MLNNILIEYKIFKKNKTIWFLFLFLICLMIYSIIYSYRNVERLDRRIDQVISQNTNEEVDISQPLDMLNDLKKGIEPIGIINNNLVLIIMIGSTIFGIIGSILVGYEFKYKTVQNRASHFGWSHTITSKLIFLLLLSVAVVVSVVIISYIEGRIVFHWANKYIHWTNLHLKNETDLNIFFQLITAVCSLFFYGTIGLMFSLITRSTLIGGLIAFIVPYMERFLSNFSIVNFFPTAWISVLINHNFLQLENSLVNPTIITKLEISPFNGLIYILILNITLCLMCNYISIKQRV